MEKEDEKDFQGMECVLFENLSQSLMKEIRRNRTFTCLKRGEFLYSEGAYPMGVYCIHEGHIKSFKIGSDGKEQIIYLGKPGDLFGWQQLTCEDPYSTSAIALDKVTVSHIPRPVFLKVVQKSSLSIDLTRYICNDIIMLETKVLELSQKSVRERLATNILILSQRFGVPHEKYTLINIPLTRTDYASLIGTNTETVIKLLSEFRKDGHIDFIERKILIIHMDVLRKISDFYL